MRSHPILVAFAAVCVVVGVSIVACGVGACATPDPTADLNVSGTYHYGGKSAFSLVGTITFEQQGALVRVTDTTYANSNDRRLRSDFAPLDGNTLAATLVPQNGDTNYRANVTFIFSPDGNSFCAEFSDTNGDAGALGSYTGTKQ